MYDKSERAMQEAVENSHVVLAVMTGDGPGDENAYLSRDFCLQELRWAFGKGTHVQPVVHQNDKERIGKFIKMAPSDLSKRIASIDFVDLNPSDKRYWDVGLAIIFDKAKARGVFPQDAPEPPSQGRRRELALAQGRSSTRRSSVEHRSRAAVAPEPADGAVEPASGESLGAKTEPVSEEPVAPLDGEIEQVQLGTAENDIPELRLGTAENIPELPPGASDGGAAVEASAAAAPAANAAKAEALPSRLVGDAALAKVGLTRDLMQDYEKGERCSFWFIRAAKLRNFSGKTPPRMQELRRDQPDWLEQREVSFTDGHAGHYVSNTLVISHCWEDQTEPDCSGVQFSAVKRHLLANEAIEWVWFDFWSMPQGRSKTEVENIEFTTMLPNINLLYLFCSVLILLDGSYMSRFWTQFEAFLSFRKVTASGLGPTPLSERRDAIICIHNADSEFDAPKLRKMWGDKTVDEAHAVLARPDVKVTNQKDKDVQLPKLQRLNDFTKNVLADV